MSKDIVRYEEGVIRSLLGRPEELIKVLEHIEPGDFENLNYKMIYDSMLDLLLKKEDINLPAIALSISEKHGAIDAGWLFDLEKDVSQWVLKATPVQWAKLLKKESTRTKAINALTEGLQEAHDKKTNPLNVMDKVASNLTSISVATTSKERFDIKEAISRFREETVNLRETSGTVAAISSAYPSIDYYTGGWAPTQLITVGARTGVGKSVFAINNVLAAIEQGKSVCFFSLEMTEREVISRIVSSLSQIPIQSIEKASYLTDEEEARVEEALLKIEASKLFIEEDPRVTVETIKRKSIEIAQSDDGLDFVVIDYLQLIQNEGKKSRQEAVAEVSRNMKILAKELNVPVMVLVQLNREKKEDDGADNIPKMYEIRESGAIAQDSNVVILIHRDIDKDVEAVDKKALFIIAKNRQGQANKFISVRSRLECSLFIDDDEKGQEVLNNLENSIKEGSEFEETSDIFGQSDMSPNFSEENYPSDLEEEDFISSSVHEDLFDSDPFESDSQQILFDE